MVIDTAKLRISTKSVATAFFSFAALMQVPEVNHAVMNVVEGHARLASLVASVISLAALLHNPQVEAALGIGDGK